MHTKGIEILLAITLGLVIPSLLVLLLQDRDIQYSSAAQTAKQTESPSDTEPQIPEISVLMDDDSVRYIPVEEYVVSVVLCEMPADFEAEALKAQAVVARTYALRRAEKDRKHENASVCTKSSCCQGFLSADSYLQKGGNQSSVEKVTGAVASTAGLVLTYEGELIDATYFSCSGGSTEDAQTVWGREVPYLKAVKSPGEEAATHYVDTIRLSTEDFLVKLGLEQGIKIRIGTPVYTVGGGVEQIEICGVNFSGTQLRKLLKLRSTAIYITVVGKTVTITTKGYGHRVGMSQYGADAMAVSGATFEEILLHYYSNVQLIPFAFD